MVIRELNEYEEEDDIVNIVFYEFGVEQENERLLLSDVMLLEGLVFLMFLWCIIVYEVQFR